MVTQNGSSAVPRQDDSSREDDQNPLYKKAAYAIWTTLLSYIIYLFAFPIYLLISILRKIFVFVNVSNLSDKCVLISGCDSGFGQAIALQLARRRITVLAGCLTAEGQLKLLELWRQNEEELQTCAFDQATKIIPFPLDVTSDASVADAYTLVVKHLQASEQTKGLWTLINNAGVPGANMPDDWISLSNYQQAMDVNFFGCVRLTHAFKELVKRERGRIVFMSSVLGHCGISNSGPYNASKFAMNGYAETLRYEMYQFGVRVIQVVPGFHRTAITDVNRVCEQLVQRHATLPPQLQMQYTEDKYLKPRIECIKDFLNRLTANNPPGNVIAGAVHATITRFPETKYWIGLDARWSFAFMRFLPPDICLWQAWLIQVTLFDGFVTKPSHVKESDISKESGVEKVKLP